MKTIPVTLAALAALGATAAQSQDANSPFSAEFEVELQSDFTVDSSAPDGEINNRAPLKIAPTPALRYH